MDIQLTPLELSELIGDIYESALTGNWDSALERIMDVTQSNKVFFFLQKLNSEKPLIMELRTNFTYSEQVLIDYQSRPFDDPYHQTTKLLTEGESHYCNEFVDIEVHRGSDYFREIFIPMKAFHVLGGILCRDGEHESVLAINRGEGDLAYTQQEKNLFKLITPHFSRAMHIFKELRLYKNYANISKSILDQENKAILVCDESGRAIITNDYANDKLTKNNTVNLINNKLILIEDIHQKELSYYIRQCCLLAYKEIGLQETLIIENDDHENLVITVSPLINKNSFNDIDIPCCLVTVTFQAALNWQKLQNSYQLTPKELQLLKAIYAKKKLNDLTTVFNVSYNTLRTHLQAIFKKVEVNSQTELMIKISAFSER